MLTNLCQALPVGVAWERLQVQRVPPSELHGLGILPTGSNSASSCQLNVRKSKVLSEDNRSGCLNWKGDDVQAREEDAATVCGYTGKQSGPSCKGVPRETRPCTPVLQGPHLYVKVPIVILCQMSIHFLAKPGNHNLVHQLFFEVPNCIHSSILVVELCA